MNITVYCGSSFGNDPDYKSAAEALGLWIAENNHTMIYGGGNIGLMGLIADVVLGNGGSVIGVIPDFLMKHEHGHEGLHRLEIVDSMSARKSRMLELGDAYIAMPGGVGTLEEIAEVITLKRLGRTDKPAFFYNINGYYEPLRDAFQQMVDKEFLPQEDMNQIYYASDVNEIAAILG